MIARISPEVHILTERELREIKDDAFQRGVERGKFEARTSDRKVARNCANWKDGYCESCGAQHQSFQVSGDYACPNFKPRTPGT